MINLEWVYYENVIKEHSENYLFDLLRTGNLQPYDQNGKQIFCPHDYHEYYHLTNRINSGEYISTEERESISVRRKHIVDSEFPDDDEDRNISNDSDPDFYNRWSWTFLSSPEDKTKKEALQLILKNSKYMKSEFDDIIKLSAKQSEGQMHVPAGTEWYDIRILFVDVRNIKIRLGPRERNHQRSYKSFGCFYNKKSKEPIDAWFHLWAMAFHKGNPSDLVGSEKQITVKHVSILQKKLKCLFPEVDGNPFAKHVKGVGWKPRICLDHPDNLPDIRDHPELY